jgi:hypothetical protein
MSWMMQTDVNQHGVEAAANGLGRQLGSHSRVHAAAHGTQHMIVRAHQLADAGNLLVNKLGHGPVLLGAADAHGKIL